jgi:hypothetical protein
MINAAAALRPMALMGAGFCCHVGFSPGRRRRVEP